jgi:PAS domain S-box-containing protein
VPNQRQIVFHPDHDDRLTGSGGFLVNDRTEWVKITRQDFAQVPQRIRIEVLDLLLQDLSPGVVVSLTRLHIHLPVGGQLLSLLTEDTLDVIWKADAALRLSYISPADQRLRGFRADVVIGRPLFEMFTAEGAAQTRQLVARPSGFMKVELEHRCKDGHRVWGEVLFKPDHDPQGALVGYHGITRDILLRKRLEAQVKQLAFHDTLTDLANRRLLMDRLTQTRSSSQRTRRCAALFLDLDNFKALNDRHGQHWRGHVPGPRLR